MLKEGETKTNLVKRLAAIESAIEEIEADLEAKQKLAEATQLVVDAEDSLSAENYEKAQLYYNTAVPAVEALVASDAKDELIQRLEDIKSTLDQAASNAMVSKLTVSEIDKDRWSVDIAFAELELADLDSLTITLFAGNREIAKHEATEATLALEESTVVAPFYFTSENQETVNEYWTVVDALKAGFADRAVITFTIGESTHTVNSADIK